MQTYFISQVKDGKPQFSKEQRIKLQGVFQAKEGKYVQVVVGDIEKGRSSQQNRYYFGVVLKLISDYTGDNVNDLHEYFKEQYAPKKMTKVLNEKKERPMSTTEMSTVEFNEYIERIRAFAAQELQVVIPDPGEA